MNIIFFIHVLILVAGIVVPTLVKDVRWLEMYSLFVPFVFFHWITNDDTCCLTQLEIYFTGQDKAKTFMSRVLDPVYNVSDDASGRLIKLTAFALYPEQIELLEEKAERLKERFEKDEERYDEILSELEKTETTEYNMKYLQSHPDPHTELDSIVRSITQVLVNLNESNE
jgi:hypothetical protein